jgi:hypothetical protein
VEEVEEADEALLAESEDSIACKSVWRSLESLAIDPVCGGGGGGGGGADALAEDVELALDVEPGVWFAVLSSACSSCQPARLVDESVDWIDIADISTMGGSARLWDELNDHYLR